MHGSDSVPVLHYQTTGSGPLVVLLHGLLMDGDSWRQNGMVASLAEHFCVVAIDLPGHGGSVGITERSAFTLDAQRAAVIKVIDSLGYHTAHIIGYSAGAWIANGLLQQNRDRLDHVVLGGWDPEKGLPRGPAGPLTFDMFISFARRTAPDLAGWVQPENEAPLRYFFEALSQPQQPSERGSQPSVPVLMWAGRDDLIYRNVASFAETHQFELLASAGDHVAAVQCIEASTRERIKAFITG
ncbi:alpha/beta fold hydrolase [Pseudomonas graminis]